MSPEDDDAERGTSDEEESTMSPIDQATVDQAGLPGHVVGVGTRQVGDEAGDVVGRLRAAHAMPPTNLS